MGRTDQFRTYNRATSAVFRKTNEEFGGLSNMAAGFPLEVNGLAIRSAEALYQACRFPHRPDLQRHVIDQRSPMTAKMVGKPHRHDSRRDWDRVRVAIMRWTLRVKLAQNWSTFGELLLATAERPIVEDSRRDDFWGAMRVDSQTLAGMNVLGRLLMELREDLRDRGTALLTVEPPTIGDFLLDGQPIEAIRGAEARLRPVLEDHRADEVRQPSLFDDQPPAQPEEPRRMLTHLAPYPAYRDSGIPWLDEVPEHWAVQRGKWLFETKKELNAGGQCTNVLSLTLRGVVNNDPDNPEGLVPKDYATYQLFDEGDLVFKLIDLENLRTSRVGLVHEHGIMSSAYLRLIPRRPLNIRYFYQQYFDLYERHVFNQLGAGVRSTLGATDLLELPIAAPPLEEQAVIVRFLDYADRRIRRYIRAKQRLIALFEEQKQAIIHRAVTRGLDPDVRLKPSGMEWLGDIPAHWEVRRLKHLYREVNERSTSGDEELLSVSHLTGVTPRSEKNITMFMAESYVGHKLCRPTDLVVNTMWAWMGALGISTRIGIVSPSYGVYRPMPTRGLLPEFAENVLKTREYVDQYRVRSTGITSSRLRLYPDAFLQIPVVLPPTNEQATIVARIADETLDLQAGVRAAFHEIDLLREYRTRLIADVVTGKLDVREAAARLPAEMDEPELLDDLDLPDSELDDLDADEVEAELAEAMT